MSNFIPKTDNPIFCGKEMNLPSIVPEICERNVVYRPQDTIFNYAAWPTVCCDENGVLYASSAAFAMEHICPFTKIAMFISKNAGKTWSPPIVVHDDYTSDAHGAVNYLGNGKMLLAGGYCSAAEFYNIIYDRIRGTTYGNKANLFGLLRAAMVDLYTELPADKLEGGCWIRLSDDYGMTWGEKKSIDISSPHGPIKCKDGTLIYLGKDCYAPEPFVPNPSTRVTAVTWNEYIDKLEKVRANAKEPRIYAYASVDGGSTWEKRALCDKKPDHVRWYLAHEPHVIQLKDGTLLGAIRVEDEGPFENQMAVYLTRSTDGGYTWSPWQCTHINGGPPHLVQHSSGAVLLTVGVRSGEKLGEFVYVSEDSGETWTKKYVLDDTSPNNDLGYPCTAEMPDGSLVTVYYQRYMDPETGIVDPKPCIQCAHWTL